MKINTIQDLKQLNRSSLKNYLLSIQDTINEKFVEGQSIDEILDHQDPFELIEPLLEKEVYPLLVPAIRNIKKKSVFASILDLLENGLAAKNLK